MSNEVLNIAIFGKKYSLPKDIITYVDEHHCFEIYRQELLEYFIDNFYDYENLPNEVEQRVYQKFRHYGFLCLQKLMANNIFNVTIDELVGSIPENYTWKFCIEASTNDGVKLFYKSLCEAMEERVDALLEQSTSFIEQTQQAEQARLSKITGIGFDIITNDIVGFGVWAAMENNAIKQQTIVANAEYRNEIDIIQKKLEQSSKNRLSRYCKDVWLPGLKDTADLFIISLFKKYIDFLILNGKFNPEALNYIDIAKSQSILQNVSVGNNKVAVLNAAFLSCPFNPDVYDIAIGNCDIEEIVKCSRLFGVDKKINSKYTNICNQLVKNDNYNEEEKKRKLAPYLQLVSLLNGKSIEATQDEFISVHRNLVRGKITEMLNCMEDASAEDVKSFIKSIIVTPISEMDSTSEDISRYILSKLIRDIIKKDNQKIYEIELSHTVDGIALVVNQYLQKVSNTKKDYLSYKKAYDEFRQSAEDEIVKLNEQISTLRLFSFSKKKELKEKISCLQEKIDDMKRRCDTFEREYYALI